MQKTTRGYTIVEILVVVAIIGILSTIAVLSYTRVQAESRNSQRSSRVTIIADALESYYDKNGEYPSCTALTQSADAVTTSVLAGTDKAVLLTPKSLSGETNSIKCGDITSSANDIYAFVGDGSAACASGAACLEWTIQYREENSGAIVTIKSRHGIVISSLSPPALSASPVSTTQINTSWTAVDYAASYRLQRATNSTFTANLVGADTASLSSSATGLIPGTTYYFRVAALRNGQQGQWSTTVSATTSGWTQIASNYFHTCGIANGKAYCWGYNAYGQLGNGTVANSSVPVAVNTSGVLAGKTIEKIIPGQLGTCAIASARAYCWGYNANGLLGNGTTTDSTVPVAVSTSGVLSGKNVTDIDLYQAACAVASGQAYCWGSGFNGNLGNGTTTSSTIPVAVNTSGVLSGKTVTDIAAASDGHGCVIASGNAFCWGIGADGNLGTGTMTSSTVPVAVSTSGVLSGKIIEGISIGSGSSCALSVGKVYCWGANGSGQLGTGLLASQENSPISVDTSGVLSGKAVTFNHNGNQQHTCAIANGQAYCWGNNGRGGLGNNSTTNSNVPVAVNTATGLAGKTVTYVATGYFQSCAIANGQAYCWGYNSYGELGNGTTTDTMLPTEVPLPN